MAKTNIAKELDKLQHRENNTPESDILKDVKLLLDGDQAKELSILHNLGLDAHLREAEKEYERKKMYEAINNEYEEFPVFSKDNIVKFCKDYRLYIRPSNEYIGTIPPDIGSVLSRFSEKYKLDLHISARRGQFFVMAPPEMFGDYKSTFARAKEFLTLAEEEKEERRRKLAAMAKDPALFYRVEKPGVDPYYVLIKPWGNDFSTTRRVLGYFTNSIFPVKLAAFLFVVCIVLGGIGLFHFFTHVNYMHTESGWVNSSPDLVVLEDGTKKLMSTGNGTGWIGWVLAFASVLFALFQTVSFTMFLKSGRFILFCEKFKTQNNLKL